MRRLDELNISLSQIASICDHTFLLPVECFKGAKLGAIVERQRHLDQFIEQVKSLPHQPYCVCVRVEDIATIQARLSSSIPICAVVGFPDGSIPSSIKVSEAIVALELGAKEIDMVLSLDAFKSGRMDEVESDVLKVTEAVQSHGGLIKCILEVSELSLDEVAIASQLCWRCGVDFVKTSTGFASGGATCEALRVMCRNFDRGIKMSGGVTEQNLPQLLAAVREERQQDFKLDPSCLRIGESGLLKSNL